MRERIIYLARRQTIPDVGTFIVNLDVVDPISCLDIIIDATNGATSCIDHEIHDDITRIEVIDGGDILHSLTMMEEQALNCFERNQMPWQVLDEAGGNPQEEACHIMFGRTSKDERLSLDPKKFLNPQLRVTHALTISATAGFATGTGAVTVIAHVLEELDTPPEAFLLSKEHYSYLTTANATEYIDLPVDYPYRLMNLQSLLTTNEWVALVSAVLLHADRRKFDKIDLDGPEAFRQNYDMWQEFYQKKCLLSAHAGTALLDLFYHTDVDVYAPAAGHHAEITAIAGEQLTHDLYNLPVATPATVATAETIRAMLEGYQPHSTVCFPMGDLAQIADWWDVTKHSHIELQILATATGNADTRVVLQQKRSY